MNKVGVSLETNYGEIEHLSQLLMKTNDNLAQMDAYVNQLKIYNKNYLKWKNML